MGEQPLLCKLTISFGGTFKMDSAQFKIRGNEMIDYIINYMETVGERRVTPDVKPGYLRPLLPESAPQVPEPWENVMQDIEEKIMLGMTHWQHPRFHAYFSSGNSYPSILGDMPSDAIGCIGFSWAAGPSCTELETIVLDWMGKMLGLPVIVDPLYLQHSNSDNAIDYRHWGVPLSRRFRALKLWFTIRSYGVSGLQAYIRNHCRLAKMFATMVLTDSRFKVVNNVQVGLVCFKLRGSNAINRKLLDTINDSGRLHMVPTNMKGEYVIRFALCAEKACEADVDAAWSIVQEYADELMPAVDSLSLKTNLKESFDYRQLDERGATL